MIRYIVLAIGVLLLLFGALSGLLTVGCVHEYQQFSGYRDSPTFANRPQLLKEEIVWKAEVNGRYAVGLTIATLLFGTCGVLCLRWFRRTAVRPGQCPACGYDLRATPGRCPECGAEPKPSEVPPAG